MSNPLHTYEQLIFTVVVADVDDVAELFRRRLQTAADTPPGLWDDEFKRKYNCEIITSQPHTDVIRHPTRYHLERVCFDLRYAYVRSPKYPIRTGWNPGQMLFWRPSSSQHITAMMSNSVCGNQHGVFRTSEEVPWECAYIALRDQDGSPGSFMFDYYRDYRTVARRLGVGQEENGKWLFCEGGPVQPFETLAYYKRRRIRDRLNREVITEYMSRIGYDITADDFWATNCDAWLLWDDWHGERDRPGRDGIDVDGTRGPHPPDEV